MKINYDEEFILGHILIDLLYTVNDETYVIKDVSSNGGIRKISKKEYEQLVKQGEQVFKNSW